MEAGSTKGVLRHAHQVYLCNRRRGIFAGEGHHGGVPGAAAQVPGAAASCHPEVGPLHQRGSRHHEPLPARRGVRHRRRRGDRPGPGPLRALYRRKPQPVRQRHQRPGVLERASTGSAGANTWAPPCRSSPISPTRSSDNIYSPWAERRTRRTWSSPKSAAPWATSRASPSWRPSARCAQEVGRENCLYHPRDPGALPARLPESSRPSPPSTRVKELLGLGICPDIMVCRCDEPIPRGPAGQDRPVLQRAPRTASSKT